jgi:predicted amidophosphoribosyltransferase
LNYHLPWIKLHYRNYYVDPVPSHASRDNERGFYQVEEIFRCSEIPIIKALFKTSDRKQSDLSQEERKNVGETIRWNDEVDITGKKILLVDDVMTTGYTIRACIKIIKPICRNHLKSSWFQEWRAKGKDKFGIPLSLMVK